MTENEVGRRFQHPAILFWRRPAVPSATSRRSQRRAFWLPHENAQGDRESIFPVAFLRCGWPPSYRFACRRPLSRGENYPSSDCVHAILQKLPRRQRGCAHWLRRAHRSELLHFDNGASDRSAPDLLKCLTQIVRIALPWPENVWPRFRHHAQHLTTAYRARRRHVPTWYGCRGPLRIPE